MTQDVWESFYSTQGTPVLGGTLALGKSLEDAVGGQSSLATVVQQIVDPSFDWGSGGYQPNLPPEIIGPTTTVEHGVSAPTSYDPAWAVNNPAYDWTPAAPAAPPAGTGAGAFAASRANVNQVEIDARMAELGFRSRAMRDIAGLPQPSEGFTRDATSPSLSALLAAATFPLSIFDEGIRGIPVRNRGRGGGVQVGDVLDIPGNVARDVLPGAPGRVIGAGLDFATTPSTIAGAFVVGPGIANIIGRGEAGMLRYLTGTVGAGMASQLSAEFGAPGAVQLVAGLAGGVGGYGLPSAATGAKQALERMTLDDFRAAARLPGGPRAYGAGVQGIGEGADEVAKVMANLKKVQAAGGADEAGFVSPRTPAYDHVIEGRAVKQYDVGDYLVSVDNEHGTAKELFVSVSRKTGDQSLDIYQGRLAGGSVSGLREVGGFIDELAQANPGARVLADPTDARRSRVYEAVGFKTLPDGMQELDLAKLRATLRRGASPPPPPTPPTTALQAAGDGGTPPPDPVAKLTALIKAAKPARRETEALKSAELSRRAGAVGGILEGSSASPRQRFQVAKGALKGQLPVAEFTAPETSFGVGEIDGLFTRILDSGLRPFEQLNTADALTKTLAGQIPTRGEMANLEKVFGPELIQALLDKRGLGAKVLENVIDVLNLPRSIATAFDASAPLRQGIILSVAHPREAASSFKAMVQAMASEKGALAVEDAIQRSKFRDVMDAANLYFAPMGKSATLSQREEAFMSRLAGKIPGIGASMRGYVTYLNKLRSDTFSTIVGNWERTGDLTPERARKLAGFINVASGRGSLGKLERAGDVLSIPFFAPRLIASRFQVPFKLIESDPFVRGVVARDLTAFVGTGIAALSLASLAGADVELDPRSTDFGRIKIGHTRIDFWGGFQPIARNAAQIITGQRKAESGAFFDTGRKDQFLRFMRSKLSPSGGAVADLWTGKTFMGEDLQAEPGFIGEQVASRFIPLFIQDVVQAAQVDGVKGALLTTPAFFGASALTYTSPARDFTEAFSNATGQDWDQMLDSERIPLVEANPDLMKQYQKWQDSREGTAAQIAKEKADGLAGIKELATTDPDEYRKQASDIVTRAAIQRDFALQAGLIKEGDYPQTPDQKAVDGYYDAIAPAFSEAATDYDLYDKLATNYLAGLSDEQRGKVMNEIAFSKDPTYRTLLQDRQTLQPYFNAPDQAYALAVKVAGQTPEGSPQRLVLQFETLTDFRQAIETTLRKAGVPETEIPGGIARVEASVGLTNLIDASRKIAIKTDPALILLLEKWGYGASKELREFAAQQVAGGSR